MNRILIKTGKAYFDQSLRYTLYRSRDGWFLQDRELFGMRLFMATTEKQARTLAEDHIRGSMGSAVELPWDRAELITDRLWPVPSKADSQHCAMCGRDIGKSGWNVIVVGGGSHICRLEDNELFEQHDSGYMGMWPVGSRCKDRLPAGLAFKQDRPHVA